MLKRIRKSAGYIAEQLESKPKTAIILGSGLGGFVEDLEIIKILPYATIPHFHATSVEGHGGNLIYASYNKVPLLVMQGRYHYYEGYTMDEVVFPIRVLHALGIENLIVSNAAGGMNPVYKIGDLVLINDHINLMPNPLIGEHQPEYGNRFVDMSEAYNKSFLQIAADHAATLGLKVHQGCYVAVTGPTYETPAEYKFFRLAGGDMVGMSTVPEVIVAHQQGMRCLAISVITDLALPGEIEYISHELVQKAAADAEPKLAKLIRQFIIGI